MCRLLILPAMPLSIGRVRLEALLDAAGRARVVAVGDAMLDEYLVGDVDRISPEAPVPVVRIRERRYALGGAANVAHNVVATGAECRLVAAIGDDAAGKQLAAMLAEIGVPKRGLLTVARPTTRKTRVVARSQQLVRIDDEDDDDLTAADANRIMTAIEDAIADADAVILEDYNKGVLVPTVIARAIEVARSRNIPVVVDPKYRHFFAYRGATVFKPNRRELESALGAAVDLEHPEAIPTAIQRLGVDHLLLTLGERGMVLASRGSVPRTVPTVAREVYDVVGAGDTVTAYLATVLGAGGTAAEAAIIANYAAGVEVGKLGAATVSPSEVLDAYDHFATHRELPPSERATDVVKR
jgi:D-beta-D-heptose 7-phosphate kinase/D-beta-D-heptose 1-phosphate adenosyltransferase